MIASVKKTLTTLNTLDKIFIENSIELIFEIFEMDEMIARLVKAKKNKNTQSKITNYFS